MKDRPATAGRGVDGRAWHPPQCLSSKLNHMGAIMSGDHFSNEDWRRLLRELGENPDRSGLLETPQRMAKAWKHWTSGYEQNPADILKVFSDGAEKYNELILVRGIPVYSHCEHHLAPFFGLATIGYTPRGSIVGLSKLTRLVDCFAKRL